VPSTTYACILIPINVADKQFPEAAAQARRCVASDRARPVRFSDRLFKIVRTSRQTIRAVVMPARAAGIHVVSPRRNQDGMAGTSAATTPASGDFAALATTAERLTRS
jgi:hypothetical protein